MLRVGDRPADRHRPRRRSRRHAPGGDVDRGLGGAVEVVQLGARAARAKKRSCELGRQRLAAARPRAAASGSRSTPGLVQEGLEHRGHEVQRGDRPRRRSAPPGRRGSWWPPGRATTRRAPAISGQKNSQTETSKLNGVFCSTRSSGVEAVGVAASTAGGCTIAAVRVHRALGPAGRARGVDHVGEVVGRRVRRGGRSSGSRGDRVPVRVEAEHRAPCSGSSAEQALLRQEHRRAARPRA